jgi:hypothetical protein
VLGFRPDWPSARMTPSLCDQSLRGLRKRIDPTQAGTPRWFLTHHAERSAGHVPLLNIGASSIASSSRRAAGGGQALETAGVARLHRRLASTPYQRNRVLALVSKFCNWAEANGPKYSNPARGIESSRRRAARVISHPPKFQRLGNVLAASDGGRRRSPRSATDLYWRSPHRNY